MIKLILLILTVMLVGAVIGMDSCTCGYGPEIRSNLKTIFNSESSRR